MFVDQRFDGLEFDDDATVHKQVCFVQSHSATLVIDRKFGFNSCLNTRQSQFMSECILIDCLAEAIAQRVVHCIDRSS